MRLSLMQILIEQNQELRHVQKNKSGDNSMIAIHCPVKLGHHLLSLFQDVPGESLEPQDFHITIGLIHNHKGREDKIQRILERAAGRLKPFPIRIKSFGIFPPHESNEWNHVLYAKPESEEFAHLHHTILNLMKQFGIDIDNGSHDFSPHITIKYCKEEPNLDQDINAKFMANKISFTIGDQKNEAKLG